MNYLTGMMPFVLKMAAAMVVAVLVLCFLYYMIQIGFWILLAMICFVVLDATVGEQLRRYVWGPPK